MLSTFFKISSILVLSFLLSSKAWGGSLNYEVWGISTYAPMLESPCYNNYAYLSTCNNTNWAGVGVSQGTGTLSSLNYNWNSSQINFGGNTNFGYDQKMAVITGYWQHPGTAGQSSTVYFAGRNDDGLIVNINNTKVISDWAQQGPTYWNSSGSFTGVGGQWYPIMINWYEWGGSANMDIHYSLSNLSLNSTSGWLDMNNNHFSTSAPVTATVATSGQSSLVTTGKGATGEGVNLNVQGDNNDINIQQAGNNNFIVGTNWSSAAQLTGDNNTINFSQGNHNTSGSSGSNGIGFDITGDSNTVSISQGDASADTGDHRVWMDIDGDSNVLSLLQKNNGDTNSEHYMHIDIDSSSNNVLAYQHNDGDKTLFLDINNNSNDVDIFQYGTGSHFLDVLLDSGSSAHDIDITQDGAGDHGARIDLSGYSYDFDLSQDSGSSKSYVVEGICATSSGCSLSTTQN